MRFPEHTYVIAGDFVNFQTAGKHSSPSALSIVVQTCGTLA
jgi:hypothetical protein